MFQLFKGWGGHTVKQCPSQYSCQRCGNKHHTLLHLDAENWQTPPPSVTPPTTITQPPNVTPPTIIKPPPNVTPSNAPPPNALPLPNLKVLPHYPLLVQRAIITMQIPQIKIKLICPPKAHQHQTQF